MRQAGIATTVCSALQEALEETAEALPMSAASFRSHSLIDPISTVKFLPSQRSLSVQ
jgi:hypothetical protein